MDPPLASSAARETGIDDLDIVILSSGKQESALDSWRTILNKYHLISISMQEEAASKIDQKLGLDHRSYTLSDVNRELQRKGLILENNTIAMAKSFAFLASNRRYVAFLDLESTLPASDPASGAAIDPFQQHLQNLRTPSTPYFFNTLYDPYRSGTDFVRGYPFSLREGVPTAVSHGLWVEPAVDLVLTVPTNVFFTFRGVNVAFDRKVIGGAMFFGAFKDESCADLWTGLCMKIICDHLRVGVKSGIPYVAYRGTADGSVGKEEAEVHEQIVKLFETVKLPESAGSDVECYMEIVKQVKAASPKFEISFDVLEAWLSAWSK